MWGLSQGGLRVSSQGREQSHPDRREGGTGGGILALYAAGADARWVLRCGSGVQGSPHSQATNPKGTTEQGESAERKWFGDPEKPGGGGRPAVWGPQSHVQTGFGEKGRMGCSNLDTSAQKGHLTLGGPIIKIYMQNATVFPPWRGASLVTSTAPPSEDLSKASKAALGMETQVSSPYTCGVGWSPTARGPIPVTCRVPVPDGQNRRFQKGHVPGVMSVLPRSHSGS